MPVTVFSADLDGEFLLTLTCDSSADLTPPVNYCLLTPEIIQRVKVQVAGQLMPHSHPQDVAVLPHWSTEQLDPPVPRISLKQLG